MNRSLGVLIGVAVLLVGLVLIFANPWRDPIRDDNPYRIDSEKMVQLIKERRPDLIVFGKSMFIYPEPAKEAFDAVQELDTKPVIMYDMAHVLGLYGAFQRPLEEGADVVTGSTHKT